MIVYRIAQKPYIRDLTGKGAYLFGGRWNLKGTYALYTASTRSLAYLEYLVHQFERNTWPSDLYISGIEILNPSVILNVDPADLPVKWSDLKYNGATQLIASDYFAKGVFGIKVPSVIVPEESNIILNPGHPAFNSAVNVKGIEKLELDKRFGP